MNRKGEWGQNLPPKLIVEDQKSGGEDDKSGSTTVTDSNERPMKRTGVTVGEGTEQFQRKRCKTEVTLSSTPVSSIPENDMSQNGSDSVDDSTSILEHDMTVSNKKSKVPRAIRQEMNDKQKDKGNNISHKRKPLTVKDMVLRMKCNNSATGLITSSENQPSSNHQKSLIFQNLMNNSNNSNIIFRKANEGQLFLPTSNHNNYVESESCGSSLNIGQSSTSSETEIINRTSISTDLHSEANSTLYTLRKTENIVAPPVLTVEADIKSVQSRKILGSQKANT